MKSDSAFKNRFKIDLAILTAVLLLSAIGLLNKFPIKISAQDDAAPAAMPQQLGQSNVLLVLPDETQSATQFPEMDFSFAWYNAIAQYVGPFSITLARDIENHANANIIIIPQNAAQAFSNDQIETVKRRVEAGATLVIEMPAPAWEPLTAIKRRAKTSSAIKRLTDATNSPLTAAFRDNLLNTPLDTQILRIDALDTQILSSDATLLEIDGAIAHYKRPLGAGCVFVLAFNFGQAITALQQGRPANNFLIETENPPKTSDLVLNERMRNNAVPFADLLKLHVFAAIAQSSPFPMLWPFPDAKRGALVISHESGQLPDDAFLNADHEKSLNIRSSWLVSHGKISKKTLKTYADDHFDIGISLIRPPTGKIYKPIGLPFFKPAAAELNIRQQKNALASLTAAPVASCKFAGAAWSRDYTVAFRQLAAAKCRIDLSYAPSQPEEFGYIFGSGFPFLPIEKNGLPLPIYEFPALVDDTAGLQTLPPNAPNQLLKDAIQTYHQPVRAHFNANTMISSPSYLSPKTWNDFILDAQSLNAWITTAKNFLSFYTLRRQAAVQYQFHPQSRTLNISLSLPESPENFTLSLPEKTSYGSIHAIRLNGAAASAKTVTADGLFSLIPIPPGNHSLQIQYQ